MPREWSPFSTTSVRTHNDLNFWRQFLILSDITRANIYALPLMVIVQPLDNYRMHVNFFILRMPSRSGFGARGFNTALIDWRKFNQKRKNEESMSLLGETLLSGGNSGASEALTWLALRPKPITKLSGFISRWRNPLACMYSTRLICRKKYILLRLKTQKIPTLVDLRTREE